MGEIHELFVFGLCLVWFVGATPEESLCWVARLQSEVGTKYLI